MPGTNRTKAARVRIRYTGETREAAEAGARDERSSGLDDCSPEQLKLRTLLALGLFNRSIDLTSPIRRGLHTLTAYTLTVSPRFKRLVLIADASCNVVCSLLPTPSGVTYLPGLRLKETHSCDTYTLLHVPTGAELVVTGNRHGKITGPAGLNRPREFLTLDTPVGDVERDQPRRVPSVSHDAAVLLAGLVCRISTKDPNGAWAVGTWFSDPLRRPGRLEEREAYERGLFGSGDRWELRRGGFPYPEDVAAALTAPVAGIPGATLHRQAALCHVESGSAALTLASRRT
ncbi:hypothetical protein [Kitasatospora sp. NPDC088783]|uniref:hypothetical protein n=1 Tax=Kitasatospora sp. NPDC088783 TaxID=3364077 RepID=UPI00380C5365